jgi:sugar phosphate isomerase/epimerase
MYLSLAMSDSCPPTWMVPLQGETKANIRTAKEIGFGAVELHIADAFSFPFADIADFCTKEDMKVSTIGTGLSAKYHGVNITSFDDYQSNYGIKACKQFIDGCKLTGANFIVGGLKGTIERGYTLEQYLDRLYEKIMPLVEYCEKLNVKMVIEAINRYETPIFNNLADTLAFVNRLDSDIAYVHSDTFHMNIEDANMVESLRACGKKMGHIHFADNIRWYPGSGSIDFQAVIDVLYEIDYKGPIAFEYFAFPNGLEAAQKGYDHIKPMLRS